MYNIMKGTDKTKQKTIQRFKFWNKWFVIPLYRVSILPFFGMGFIFILLYNVGRKSGKQRYTPLEYLKKDGKILLFSSRGSKSDWFRNVKANPESVKVKHHFRKYKPAVRIVDTIEERLDLIIYYMQKRPSGAKALFGWKKVMGYEREQYQEVAEYLQIVELTK